MSLTPQRHLPPRRSERHQALAITQSLGDQSMMGYELVRCRVPRSAIALPRLATKEMGNSTFQIDSVGNRVYPLPWSNVLDRKIFLCLTRGVIHP